MTREEKIVATAFTGRMFIDGSDMGLLYEYMEKKVGHGVIDLMLADKGFWEELHRACEKDFINMISKKEPSLPDDLDETAREIVIKMHPCLKDCTILGDRLTRGQLMDLVKAGAEWMAEHLAGVRKMIEPERKEGRTGGSSQGEVPNDSLATQSYENIPNDLDEAAENWCKENNKGIALGADKKSHYLADGMDAFKAGAEWAMQQLKIE